MYTGRVPRGGDAICDGRGKLDSHLAECPASLSQRFVWCYILRRYAFFLVLFDAYARACCREGLRGGSRGWNKVSDDGQEFRKTRLRNRLFVLQNGYRNWSLWTNCNLLYTFLQQYRWLDRKTKFCRDSNYKVQNVVIKFSFYYYYYSRLYNPLAYKFDRKFFVGDNTLLILNLKENCKEKKLIESQNLLALIIMRLR